MNLPQVINCFLYYNANLSQYLQYPNLKIRQDKKTKNFILTLRTETFPPHILERFANVKGLTSAIPFNELNPHRAILSPSQMQKLFTSWGMNPKLVVGKKIKVCKRCSCGYSGRPRKINKRDKICPDCFDADFRYCKGCKKWIDRMIVSWYTLNETTTYCTTCVVKYTYRCWQDGMRHEGTAPFVGVEPGIQICENCFDRFQWCQCAICQKVSKQGWDDDDCINYCYETKQFLCTRDFKAHTCAQKHLRKNGYSFVVGEPDPYMDNIQRFVGVEIEAEEGQKSDTLNREVAPLVDVGSDGSINGVELRTPPAMGDKIASIIEKTCEGLQKHNYVGTVKCGLHIHIDANDIKNNKRKLLQVVKTYYAIEDILWSMLPPSRWASRYCRRLTSTHPFDNIFTKKLTLEQAWTGNGAHPAGHYQGLNLASLDDCGRGTIEIRYHSGTTNAKKIINWIAINLRIFNYAVKKYKAPEIQRLVDMPTGQQKFEVFCNLFNMSPDLINYMSERIDKFNPNWHVVFNKGKLLRIIEKEQKQYINAIVEGEIKKLSIQMKRKLVKQYKQSYGQDWIKVISRAGLNDEAYRLAEQYFKQVAPVNYLRELGKIAFLSETQIREQAELYQKIIQVGARPIEKGERDKEFNFT